MLHFFSELFHSSHNKNTTPGVNFFKIILTYELTFTTLAQNLNFMSLYSRVRSNPGICGLELAFTGTLLPSIIEGYQPFNNSLTQGTDFQPASFGLGSVSFIEESQESNAGKSYKQKLIIRFLTSDKSRAYRMDALQKVKYLKIKLSNGRDLVLGRNDFEQNARPAIQSKADEKMATVEFETVSIVSAGYTPNIDASGLPDFIPLDLISEGE